MKCTRCGRTGRDTRFGLCDLCAFPKKGATMATKKRKAPKKRTPPRGKNGRFKKRK